MRQGAEQVRLAIGIFDAPSALWSTVPELLEQGFSLEQFCLVATASTAAGINRPEVADETSTAPIQLNDDCIGRLYRAVETWPGTANGQRIVATSGLLLHSLLEPELTAMPSTRAGISGEHTLEMLSQVESGAIALIIKSLTPAQQRLSTRALLRQSSHRVKTYDFAKPTARDEPRVK